jgi:hypothetical protein
MKKQMTIRDLRRVLFLSDGFAIVNTEEMTNKQARDFFYNFDNQDKIVNVIETNTISINSGIKENCVNVWYL